jgi:hypothetical protein
MKRGCVKGIEDEPIDSHPMRHRGDRHRPVADAVRSKRTAAGASHPGGRSQTTRDLGFDLRDSRGHGRGLRRTGPICRGRASAYPDQAGRPMAGDPRPVARPEPAAAVPRPLPRVGAAAEGPHRAAPGRRTSKAGRRTSKPSDSAATCCRPSGRRWNRWAAWSAICNKRRTGCQPTKRGRPAKPHGASPTLAGNSKRWSRRWRKT